MDKKLNNLLNLKMTDQEYRLIATKIRQEEGLDSRDYVDIPYQVIEDAVISKVTWSIHDWMIDQSFYDPNIDSNPATLLRHILQASDIEKL